MMLGPWVKEDINNIPKNGLKVFSCFHGGGGSCFGYELAGFEIVGGVELDPDMVALYRANHNLEYSYPMSISDFNKILDSEIPNELNDIDILDGSPPCSSFSLAGARDRKWGKDLKFREGQSIQILDDLFFDFLDTAEKLRPKVIIAENVKDMMLGKAKGYVAMVMARLKELGYRAQLFLLKASMMGVPQARERLFFIATRSDLNYPQLKLTFDEEKIPLRKALKGTIGDGRKLPPSLMKEWKRTGQGKLGKAYKGCCKARWEAPCPTITSKVCVSEGSVMHPLDPRKFSVSETIRISTFPEDYNFLGQEPGYVMGMSVPPFMMQRIANQVATQFFSKEEMI